MSRMKNGVRIFELGPLRAYAPCRCYEENPSISYYVKTHDCSSYVYGEGPVVKEIIIECNCCGKSTRANVESDHILDKDLRF